MEEQRQQGLGHWLKSRIKDRPDTEAIQALIRVALVVVVSGYFLACWLAGVRDPALDYSRITVTMTGSLAATFAILAWVLSDRDANPVRRTVGAVHDMAASTLCLIFGGHIAAPLYAVYLWVTLGNGFRYGVQYLRISQALSILGFVTAWIFTPFFREEPWLSAGLTVTLILIPTYASGLLKMLHAAKQRAEEQRMRAEEASAAKSRFVSIVSHEFRTPLNAIIGTGQLLSGSPLNKDQREWVGDLNQSSAALMALVEGVLDLSRIEAGRMDIRLGDVAIRSLARECFSTVKGEAKSKGLRLSWECAPDVPDTVVSDGKLLREIVLNLLGNAVKFTDKGSVELLVSMDESAASTLRIEVRDSGIGIPAEKLERVFHAFTQLDDTASRRYGGAGLGTTISKQLAESLGGSIDARSIPGRGSTFYVRIPVEIPGDDRNAGEAPRTAVSLAGKSFLLVGLPVDAAATLSGWIERWGGRSASAATLEEARSICRTAGVPFAVLAGEDLGADDIAQLPGTLRAMSGAEGLRCLVVGSLFGLPEHLAAVGFDGTIGVPLVLPQVFTLLHHSDEVETLPDQVVSLTEARRKLAGGRQLEVLVADDSAINQRILTAWLSRAGHSVTIAGSGEAMLDSLETKRFDVMLVDYNMPDLDGVAALTLYRATAVRPYCPAIMVSADAQPERVKAALDAGYAAFVPKPYRIEALAEAIQSALEGATEPASSTGERRAAEPRKPVEVLDLSMVKSLQSLSSRADFYREIATVMLEDAREKQVQMRTALEAGHYREVRELAHALRGNAGNVGAVAIAGHCAEMERLPPSGLAATGKALVEELGTLCDRTGLALEALEGESTSRALLQN